jgi:F-type H+-transporting ATPase subunit epsilon
MHLEIITPNKKLFTGEVTSVQVPGTAGQFQVLKNHAPIISTLIKGKVKIKSTEGAQDFDINGGVIEVLKNNIIVLAE